MATVSVRYIVHDIDAAIDFYTKHLGFTEVTQPGPALAVLTRGDLRLLLSSADAGSGEPGGWNRFSIEVTDLPALVGELQQAGVTFRNDIGKGVYGRQILLDDPSGNPVELIEPA
jgi:catechol 2,3-dioxygenase-like lactoylglutathione lyase family enzyme